MSEDRQCLRPKRWDLVFGRKHAAQQKHALGSAEDGDRMWAQQKTVIE